MPLQRLVALAVLTIATPASALDLNAFRAQHGKPPLSMSSALSAAAHEHAQALAVRQRLDHDGFRARLGSLSSTAAENVAYGCDTEDCVIRKWAKSGGHRRNMLMNGVSSYGIASATADNGRRYWVLVVGN